MDSVIVQTAHNVDLAFTPASLGDRILAWLVDLLVVAAYYVVLWFVGVYVFVGFNAVVSVLATLPILLYHLVCEVVFEGQSVGKRAMKIQVARVDGAPPTLGQYLLRWMLRWVDVTFSAGLVALVAIAATARSQRLGDVAAGTTVIRQRRRVGLADVRYPARPPGYAVTFPDAERLTDADVRTLRAVLVRLRQEPEKPATFELGRRAKTAVEARLGLERVDMRPELFLTTVVLDYTSAHDRYAG